MSTDEKNRLELRDKLQELLGTRVADIAMEAMPPLDYKELATKTDVANLGIELRGEIARLDGTIAGLDSKIDGLGTSLRGEITGLDSGLTGRIDGLDSKIDGLDRSLNAKIEALDNSLTAAIDKLVQLTADRRTTLVSVFGMLLAMGGFIVGFG